MAPEPACDACEAAMVPGTLVPWYCVNCDQDEAGALERDDEARREAADAAYEREAAGCTCDEYGDYQCDAHGADVIAAQRAEHERWELREACRAIARISPEIHGTHAHHRLREAAAEILLQLDAQDDRL